MTEFAVFIIGMLSGATLTFLVECVLIVIAYLKRTGKDGDK